MKTFKPTDYKAKLLGIKSGDKVSCDNALLICSELEYYYLQEIRRMQEETKADTLRLNKVLQNAINALDRINQKHVFTHTDGDGGELPECYWGMMRKLGDVNKDPKDYDDFFHGEKK